VPVPRSFFYEIPIHLPKKKLLKKLLDFEFPANRINRVLNISYQSKENNIMRPQCASLKYLIQLLLDNISAKNYSKITEQELSQNVNLIFTFLAANVSTWPSAESIITKANMDLFAIVEKIKKIKLNFSVTPESHMDRELHEIDNWIYNFKSNLRGATLPPDPQSTISIPKGTTKSVWWTKINIFLQSFF
jgi:hypothetical protein